MQLVPTLHFGSFAEAGRAADGVHVVVRGFKPDGQAVDLQMSVSCLDTAIATLSRSRDEARAGGADTSAQSDVHVPTSWRVSFNERDPTVVFLIFDHASPSQAFFGLDPSCAREIGRALIAQTREAEAAASRIIKS
jgi:hypothetical protein